MTDRTVTVVMQARINSYMTSMATASKATADFANKVDLAKGRTAAGFHTLGVAGVAFGTVVAGGFALAVKSAADFEAKMALVRTLAHASASDMKQLHDAALTVGQAYGYTAGQVADAEAELVKAGVSVADILGGALTGALTLASAGQTDVATATTIAATAMTQFQLKGKDVPHIADLLAAGADKALGSVVDLGYALDQAGPQAHQFGVSLEETVGTLASFAQSGQIGERGGTIFTQMLLKLAAPGKQSSDILKQLGINIYGTNGQFVGMANLAGQLQTKMSGLTEAERNHDLAVVFGQRAIRGANILYQEGAKGVEDWTTKVNAAGFAALQSAGKLDSLSGDVTKLRTALSTAFIGAGESGQGPLRLMVQDVTQAVLVWNELPAPVRAGAEAFTLVAGAVTLAGGAALLFIPKWTAMNVALKETSVGAVTASRAMTLLGRTGTVITGLAAVGVALEALHRELRPTAASADAFANSLITLSQSGVVSGDLQKFVSNLKLFANSGFSGSPGGVLAPQLKSVDQALADMVTSGHLDTAQKAFGYFSTILQHAGYSATRTASLFPTLSAALSDSATSARLAGNGVDKYGNSLAGATKKTLSATDAAKKYSNQLHALADPLFAMNQALQGVTDAQAAATQAVHKYGADSPQAKQANLDLASSALDAEAAARTLAASVKNGSVSIGAARKFLKSWVADGLLTKQQADDVSGSFDHLIGRAETISGLHPHLQVTADTSQAETALSNLLVKIGQVISGFFQIGHPSGINPQGGVGVTAYGPGIPVAKTGGQSSSPSVTSDSGYYVTPSSGGGGSSSGGGSGGSGGGSSSRPPTVQEIVHAILTGTIPPSIDKLSHVLQTEISHLSTVVGNAQQYRSSVRSTLLGYASLSNIGTGGAPNTDSFGATDVNGRSMGSSATNVNSYLKGRLAQLKQFAHLRQRLEHAGAGEGLMAEFDAIGPDANPMMQQLLGQGHKAVVRATRLEHRITHLSGVEAGAATSDKYGPQLVHLMQMLPTNLARDIAKQLKHQKIYVDLTALSREQGRRIRAHS